MLSNVFSQLRKFYDYCRIKPVGGRIAHLTVGLEFGTFFRTKTKFSVTNSPKYLVILSSQHRDRSRRHSRRNSGNSCFGSGYNNRRHSRTSIGGGDSGNSKTRHRSNSLASRSNKYIGNSSRTNSYRNNKIRNNRGGKITSSNKQTNK